MSVFGLVVCGGKSTRMGTDKSLLNYHGKPQRYHLYELLEPLCDKVFISCNKDQAPTIPAEYSVIVDDPEYENIGPIAALLSAFKQHPEASFLVVGCDYPMINNVYLQRLLKASLQANKSACFYSVLDGFYEPLIAVYQPVMFELMKKSFMLSNCSLQRVLREADVCTIEFDRQTEFTSVDTTEAYRKTVAALQNMQKNL